MIDIKAMRELILSIIFSTLLLSFPAKANTEYQCLSAYQEKIKSYYPEGKVGQDDDRGWAYNLRGYYWLTKVVGHSAAAFFVTFVPGAIPFVLTATAVSLFFEVLKNEKGIVGSYIILKMSELEEDEIANQDVDSKIEEEVLDLQENKYSRETNLFNTFVKKVNKKYKNSDFSYEEVRQAVIELATVDDQLCQRKGKEKFSSLRRLIRLTKKKLLEKK